MALGGGTFLTQNKILPGAYINVVSSKRANAGISDRGVCTIAMELDWGLDDEVMELTLGEFIKNSKQLLGYDYGHEALKGLRDVFQNARVLYLYKLNKGVKAANDYATAKHTGVRGNAITIVVQKNVDEPTKTNVSTVFDGKVVDVQVVKDKTELKANDFVDFKTNINLETVTAGTPLTGGTNGAVNAENHQNYLKKIESYGFNIMGAVTKDEPIKKLYAAFTKRMRDEVGQKFQTVLFNFKGDSKGIINVKNPTLEDGPEAVFYTTGLQAGTGSNKTADNKDYRGEYAIKADYSQAELEKAVLNGEFVYHKVGKDIKVLLDINSLTTLTDEEGEVFKSNQTVRVVDQIANDIAVLFNTRYLGEIPNNKSGRTSLWSDVVKLFEELQKLEAIEDFKDEDVTVEEGADKRSVFIKTSITPVNAMAKLYMVIQVS